MAIEQTPSQRYGLRYPTLPDAHRSLARVHGAGVDRLWPTLLAAARLTGAEQDRDSIDRLIEAMAGSDAMTQLTAYALRIRARSFDHLSAADDIIRSAQ